MCGGQRKIVAETERRHGIVRENSLAYAMQTAELGEDPMAILARAQLYEEYQLPDFVRDPHGVGVQVRKPLRDLF